MALVSKEQQRSEEAMALDNLSPVGIGLPLWFVLSAMNGVCNCAAKALREVDLEASGF
jgi:hypothetical protein